MVKTKRLLKLSYLSWTIFMVVADGIMTDIALHGNGFYETNPFTNTFGVLAHTMMLLAILLFVGTRVLEKDCLVSESLTVLMCIFWTLNNLLSLAFLTGVI